MASYFDSFVLPFIKTAEDVHRDTGQQASLSLWVPSEIFDVIAAEHGVAAAGDDLDVHPCVTLRRGAKGGRRYSLEAAVSEPTGAGEDLVGASMISDKPRRTR